MSEPAPIAETPTERKRARMRANSTEKILRAYTEESLHTAVTAIVESLAELKDQMIDLSKSVQALTSRLDIAEQSEKRQDKELWSIDGLARMEPIRAKQTSLELQIKGLWATVGLTLTTLTGLIFWLLHK